MNGIQAFAQADGPAPRLSACLGPGGRRVCADHLVTNVLDRAAPDGATDDLT